MADRGVDLIAIDADGTLLDAQGRVVQENIDAFAAAVSAGVRPVVCTGRGLIECERILEALGQRSGEPVIVAGGAIVAAAGSSRTLHRFALDVSIVSDTVDLLNEMGYAALVLKDRDAAGFDYLVVSGPQEHGIDPVTTWWFNELRVEARFVRTLADDPHPEQSVRVGLCCRDDDASEIAERVQARFGDRVTTLIFSAVAAPESCRLDEQGRPFQIMEVFDANANKWSAVRWLCEHLGIDPARTAAIGDELNDVPMVSGAGVGIAMGNARAEVLRVANQQTRTNNEAGVAYAIEQLLSGAWTPEAAGADTR